MRQDNTYKYLSIGLAIVALIFATLYFTKPEPTVGDIYEDITDNVEECSTRISEWNAEYGSQASSTKKQNALDDILNDCQETLSTDSDKLE